jgi:hypothetical protein
MFGKAWKILPEWARRLLWIRLRDNPHVSRP